MLLGLIADTHADLASTQQALALLDNLGAEQIICAGDLVEKWNEPDAVVELIRAREIDSVKGNHDVDVALNQHWLRPASALLPQYKGRLIRSDTLHWLRNLPNTRRYVFEGRRVLLAHGTLRSYRYFLFPQSRARVFRSIAKTSQADYVVLGHTHIPMRVDVDGMTVLNPGSVCKVHSWGSGTCATLSLPGGVFTPYSIRTGEPVQNFAQRSI